MKPLAKIIRAAHTQGKPWKREVYKFLLNYRATPHPSTKLPPATVLFNRTIRTKLPQLSTSPPQDFDVHVQVNEADQLAKQRMKFYSDRRTRAKPSSLKVGDTVIALQLKQNKLSTKFDPRPYTVTAIKGTMITATRPGKQLTRNSSHFKKVPNQQQENNRDVQPTNQPRYPQRRNRRPPQHFHDDP